MRNTLIKVWLLIPALVLGGCAGNTSTIRYYMLDPANGTVENRTTATGQLDPVIGLGPVTMPEYLARSQLVIRDTDTEIELLDEHRWAEPLEDQFSRVLALNLSKLLPTSRLVIYPSRSGSGVTHQLSIAVHRFDANRTGGVVLQVSWTLTEKQDPQQGIGGAIALDTGYSPGGDYAAMAKAMSQLVAQLAQQLSRGLQDRK